MKICALLVPREMRVEHSSGVKAMTDEQLEAGIAAVEAMLARRAGDDAKVIEATPEKLATSPTPRITRKASRTTGDGMGREPEATD